MKKILSVLLGSLTLAFSPAGAFGQVITPVFNDYSTILGGTDSDYQWSGFSAETRPVGVSSGTSGTAGQWASGIAPTNASSSATFSGTPGFGTETTDFISSSGGGGIYTFFSPTHFTVADAAPLAGIESLTFQVYLAAGLTGAFGGSPIDLFAAPTLTLNTTTGTQTLSANFSLLSSSTAAVVNGSSTSLDLLNYQWDLSTVTGTVQSYSVNWQTSYHSITMGEDLTESTASHAANVLVAAPEPSTYALVGLGMGLLYLFRRGSMNRQGTFQA